MWPYLTSIFFLFFSSVVKLDADFTGKLYESYISAKKVGITQPLSLGIFRSDYIVHKDEPGYKGKGTAAIKQVEFNTVSVSFGALSSKVSQLHTYLSNSGIYGPTGEQLKDKTDISKSIDGLADGLAVAHKSYCEALNYNVANKKVVVLFVTQPGERNVFDQRHIEYSLYNNHGVSSYRLTLAQIRKETKLVEEDGVKKLVYLATGEEISVVYYRSGYAPTDFPTEEEWAARVYLETSHAIKCPTLLTQLSGAKKVQQILTTKESISQFLNKVKEPASQTGNENDDIDLLLSTFVKLYPMDTSADGLVARKLAVEEPHRFVLKPQREGGGNNVYKENIPNFLKSLPEEQWGAYILMELISPPKFDNKILRAGEIYNGPVVSELGVFGVVLWNSDTTEIISNEQAGWLLRSKLQSSDEGGVAAGFGCIDSVYLF